MSAPSQNAGFLKQATITAVFIAVLWGVDQLLQIGLNPYYVRVVVNCGIAAILALSLNLINGCAGQFSLGHAGFMAVGAYVSATLTTVYPAGEFFQSPLGVGVAITIGGIVAALAGYLVGLPSLRLKGDYLAIVTLGFSEMIRVCFLNIPAVGGARGMNGIPVHSSFFWVYLWAALAWVFFWRLLRSGRGRAILALRDDETAAEAMGVEVSHFKVVSFSLSSAFAGIAGGLFAHYQGFIDPQSFDFSRSVLVVIMVVLGGMGSLSGAVLGAVVVTVLPESLRVFESYRLIIFPLVLILMMLLRPKGILGHREIWEFFPRRAK
ncbi:branched-chain amino acid ABC transporter permease [bacterium]|nr:branched-chain amino acid ABC transporter permease [bacterium]